MPIDYAHVRPLLRNLEKVGVDLPAEVKAIATAREAALTAANSKPALDFAALVEKGEVTEKNAVKLVHDTATALAAQQYARAAVQAAEPAFASRTIATLVAAGDDIITQLRPTFDEATATVAASRDIIGGLDQADVLRSGPTVIEAWTRLTSATATLHLIHQVRGRLSAFGYGNTTPPSWYLVLKVPNADVLARAAEATRAQGNAIVNLITAGFRLHLNTATESEELDGGARRAAQEAARMAAEADRERRSANAAQEADRYRRPAPAAS